MAIVRPLCEALFQGPTGSPCGGIGRRARLKIEFRKECWFDPGQGHHIEIIRLLKASDFGLGPEILVMSAPWRHRATNGPKKRLLCPPHLGASPTSVPCQKWMASRRAVV